MANVVEIPKSMKALVVQEVGNRVAVQEHPVPELGPEDILVKTVTVAQNPTDGKFIHSGRANPGAVLGCDYSGHVVAVGPRVTDPALRIGAHVAGFVMGATFADSGAFAEYVRTPASLAWAVPEGTLSHEEAATMCGPFWTAAQVLFDPKGLGLVEPPAIVSEEEWVYVHGGASSVGQYTIQLAALSGYSVVTSSSARHFPLLTALGAAATVDYHDADVVEKVKAAAHDSIRVAVDAISLHEAQAVSVAVIRPGGGKVVHLLPVIPEATGRTDVERSFTLLYTALGRAFTYATGQHTPASPDDRAYMERFLKKVPGLVQEGKIRPLPIKLWEGGLAAIPDGLEYMRQGKVSGEKIVYRV